ncbi:hypothetical protein [uncultured Klebsiella sp.]|uniref:hypothetical protein n=1 Tax=uncultured Klebsiella sp. TaxID=284011 RepID=UPI0028054824|nr:hypothetical protein [uncultured Klebsiella sp.]
MLWSMLVAIPVTLCGFLYTTWLGKRIYIVPMADDEGFLRERLLPEAIDVQEDEKLPRVTVSFAPLLVPIVLILAATFCRETGIAESQAGVWQGAQWQ